MRTLFRRTLDVLVATVAWGVAWAAVGYGLGSILGKYYPALLPLLGFLVGGIAGFSFAVLVMVGERRGQLDRLRAGQVSLWGLPREALPCFSSSTPGVPR